MSNYIPKNPDELDDSIFPSTLPQNPPLPPVAEGVDTVYPPVMAQSQVDHVHHWVETDEGHPDGQLTALCSCGYGITYYPQVHGVLEGKLINKNE